jgi:hypothetical protein
MIDGMRLEQAAEALGLTFSAMVELVLKDERTGLLELVPPDGTSTSGADTHGGFKQFASMIRHSPEKLRLVAGTDAEERERRPLSEQLRYDAITMCTVERALLHSRWWWVRMTARIARRYASTWLSWSWTWRASSSESWRQIHF